MKAPIITPGEWHVEDGALWAGRHGLTMLVSDLCDEAEPADLKFIAAAPDMYEALNSMLCEVRARGIHLDTATKVLAAMVKAGATH